METPENQELRERAENILKDIIETLSAVNADRMSPDNYIEIKYIKQLQNEGIMRNAIQNAVNYVVHYTQNVKNSSKVYKFNLLSSFITNTQIDASLFMRVKTFDDNLIPKISLTETSNDITKDIHGTGVGKNIYEKGKIRFIKNLLTENNFERPRVYYQFENTKIQYIPIIAMAIEYKQQRKLNTNLKDVNIKILENLGEEVLILIMSMAGLSISEIWENFKVLSDLGKDVIKIGSYYVRNSITGDLQSRDNTDPIGFLSSKVISLDQNNICFDVYEVVKFINFLGNQIGIKSNERVPGFKSARQRTDEEKEELYTKLAKPISVDVSGTIGMSFVTLADVFKLIATSDDQQIPLNTIISIINERRLNEVAVTYPINLDVNFQYIKGNNVLDQLCSE